MAKQKINPAQQNNAVTTGTNAGSSGGSANSINLGGLKICWGLTNSASVPSGGAVPYAVTFPLTYTVAPFVQMQAFGSTAYNDWMMTTVSAVSTTTATGNIHNTGAGASGAEQVMWIAIGV